MDYKMTKKYPIPYLFEVAKQLGSYQVALEKIRFKRCLYCGRHLDESEEKEFCSRACKRTFYKWRGINSQQVGTIKIRPKRRDETWEEYHDYLNSLKVW